MKIMVVVCALFTLFVTGCESTPWEVARKNVENSKQLRVGMTKQEVLAIMGEPVKNESFNKPDVWFYYFNMNWGDGFITEDECFPLVFKNGKLTGWGNAYYTRARLENKNLVPAVDLTGEIRRAAAAEK